MKKTLLGTFVAAALAAITAFAQNTTMLKADVPFDFTAGNQTFSAGRYTVVRGTAPSTIMIRSDDGKKGAIVLTQAALSVTEKNNACMVFHRYGSAYFLSEVWTPGYDGRTLTPTKREREMAVKATPTATSIAALR